MDTTERNIEAIGQLLKITEALFVHFTQVCLGSVLFKAFSNQLLSPHLTSETPELLLVPSYVQKLSDPNK